MYPSWGKVRIGAIAILGAVVFAAALMITRAEQRAVAAAKQPDPIAAAKAQVPSAPNHSPHISLATLPMRFEPNLGQTDPQVKFLSRGQGYTLFITPDEAVIAMRQSAKEKAQITQGRNKLPSTAASESAVVRIALKGAARAPQIGGLDRMAAGSNYFIGNDPKKWHTDVPNYAEVELKSVYPGIDLIYHGSEQARLEYDFRLAPGADPKAIRLNFSGMKKLALNRQGDLVVGVGKSQLVEPAPAIYQETADSKRQTIAGGWVIRGAHEAGFQVAAYDRTKVIVIDPVLLYSTYLGGSDGDNGFGIAVDSSGNAYVTGITFSTNFPTLNAFQGTLASSNGNVFVAKLNPSASGAASLLYSSYLGGSSNSGDFGYGIAVDSSDNAYVTGYTSSTNFPTMNAFQGTVGGSDGNAFVAKLNPAASGAASLLYSTYLGGSSFDAGTGIAVDSEGNAYVTGIASSTNFPTLNAFQSTNNAAAIDESNAFVAKLNPSASGAASLLYSTYLGGSGYLGGSRTGEFSAGDNGYGIAVDSSGNAYVAGQAFSTDFPVTAGAYQSTNNAATNPGSNAFVAELNPSASGAASLLYSTYLGGSGSGYFGDTGRGIAADSSGNAYVTGIAGSIGNSSCTDSETPEPCCSGAGTGTCVAFPTLNAYQSTNNSGQFNAFVAKLNPSASGAASLLYSTYLGGSSGLDDGFGIAIDSSGNAYVAGSTFSTNFPTLNASQSALAGSNDAFVAKLNPAVSGAASLLYSTYLGGSGNGGGNGIAVDSSGNAYVTGNTSSIGNSSCTGGGTPESCCSGSGTGTCVAFPTLNAYQSTPGDAFVAELSPATPGATPTATATATATATPTATATATPTTTLTVTGSLAFGNVPVGDTETKSITVHNSGATHSLVISSVMASDPEYALSGTGTCGAIPVTLGHGASCALGVAFTPSTLGAHPATIQVFDNASSSPQSVAATGTGTATLTVTPTSIMFGSVKDGSKTTKTITVHNYQTNPVVLTTPHFSGPNAGDFSVTGPTEGTCTTQSNTLGATSSCTLIVTYTPIGVGTESATMTIGDSPDSLGPYTVSFTTAETIPESITPTSLHFSNVAQTASKTLDITVNKNATGGPITLTGASIGGANAGDFSAASGSCTTLPGGSLTASSCNYVVTFTPSTETAESGTLSIGVAEDPNGGPPTVNLSGTGITPLKLVPAASVSFGNVAPGHSSVDKVVTVTNNGGAAVSLSENITGGNSSDFAVTGGTCTTLIGGMLRGNGASCEYGMTFTPGIVGPESATLGVSAGGDAASPHKVSLSGTGS